MQGSRYGRATDEAASSLGGVCERRSDRPIACRPWEGGGGRAGRCRLLNAIGYDVVSEYYINDAGRQMKLLVICLARYQELSRRTVEFPADGYHGAYILRWQSR